MDREKVIRAVDSCFDYWLEQHRCLHPLELENVRQLKADSLSLLKELNNCENCAIAIEDRQPVVRCKDCKQGSLYCTEDVCGEPLIECNRPDLGDRIEIHGWKWFCADGERKNEDA